MAFVRVKRINGNNYCYLVENEWQKKGSRQTVKAYLGKLLKPEASGPADAPDISANDYKESVITLASWTLQNHGFRKNGGIYENLKISVNFTEKTVKNKGKKCALELNEGFLCEHTLRQLLDFVGEGTKEEEVGKRLASSLLEAGLSVPKEKFVQLFSKTFKPLQEVE